MHLGRLPLICHVLSAACVLPSGLAGHIPALLLLDSVGRVPCMVPPSQLAVESDKVSQGLGEEQKAIGGTNKGEASCVVGARATRAQE